jgi:hypothetical protein
MPTFHLRSSCGRRNEKDVWEDMKKVRDYLAGG